MGGGWCFAHGTTYSLAPGLGWPQTNILTLSALDPVAGAKAWGKVLLLLGWALRPLAPANVLHLPTTTHLLPPSRSHLSLSFLCGSSWPEFLFPVPCLPQPKWPCSSPSPTWSGSGPSQHTHSFCPPGSRAQSGQRQEDILLPGLAHACLAGREPEDAQASIPSFTALNKAMIGQTPRFGIKPIRHSGSPLTSARSRRRVTQQGKTRQKKTPFGNYD